MCAVCINVNFSGKQSTSHQHSETQIRKKLTYSIINGASLIIDSPLLFIAENRNHLLQLLKLLLSFLFKPKESEKIQTSLLDTCKTKPKSH